MDLDNLILAGLWIANPAAGLIGSVVHYITDEQATFSGLVTSIALGGTSVEGNIATRVLNALGSTVLTKFVDTAVLGARSDSPIVNCTRCGERQRARVIGTKGETWCRECFLVSTKRLKTTSNDLAGRLLYDLSHAVYYDERRSNVGIPVKLMSSVISRTWPLACKPPKWITLGDSRC